MHVAHLSLVDFRSYPTLELPLQPGVTTLLGANAQGKTNLLEAVGYLATLGSHRVSSRALRFRRRRRRRRRRCSADGWAQPAATSTRGCPAAVPEPLEGKELRDLLQHRAPPSRTNDGGVPRIGLPCLFPRLSRGPWNFGSGPWIIYFDLKKVVGW